MTSANPAAAKMLRLPTRIRASRGLLSPYKVVGVESYDLVAQSW